MREGKVRRGMKHLSGPLACNPDSVHADRPERRSDVDTGMSICCSMAHGGAVRLLAVVMTRMPADSFEGAQ